jgi:hypothetical protein
MYHTEPPTDKTIREWYRKFEEMGCVLQKEQAGQGHRLRLWTAYENPTRSPHKSTRRKSRELDMSPPHFHLEVRRHLNTTLPQRWIGRTSRCNGDSALIPWPPRSPDLTPCDSFLWGYVKIMFTCPLYQEIYRNFRQRIVAAVDTIDVDMLQRVWQELDYRIDVCRVIRGGHMEHL